MIPGTRSGYVLVHLPKATAPSLCRTMHEARNSRTCFPTSAHSNAPGMLVGTLSHRKNERKDSYVCWPTAGSYTLATQRQKNAPRLIVQVCLFNVITGSAANHPTTRFVSLLVCLVRFGSTDCACQPTLLFCRRGSPRTIRFLGHDF